MNIKMRNYGLALASLVSFGLCASTPAIRDFTASPVGLAPDFTTTLVANFSGGTGVIQPGNIPITSGNPVEVHPKMTTRYELVVSNSVDTPAKASVTARPPEVLSMGQTQTVLAIAKGRIYAWGSNGFWEALGRVPVGVVKSPTMNNYLFSTTSASIVSNNYYHSLCLANGSIFGWGRTASGETGVDPYLENGGVQLTNPKVIQEINNVVGLSAGTTYGMALTHDGSVWAWGRNQDGHLGVPSQYFGPNNNWTATPQRNNHFTAPIAAISAGNAAMALDEKGVIWAWGGNNKGETAQGNASSSKPIPAPMLMLTKDPRFPNGVLDGVSAITSGQYSSFALRIDGSVWSCGNSYTLGLGTPQYDSSYFVQVKLPTPTSAQHPVSISAGGAHCLVLMSDGTVWGWGHNGYGQIGDGTNTMAYLPKQIAGLSNIVAVEAGTESSFAVAADGTVWGWGRDDGYQLGLGNSTPMQSNGLPVRAILTPKTIPDFKLW